MGQAAEQPENVFLNLLNQEQAVEEPEEESVEVPADDDSVPEEAEPDEAEDKQTVEEVVKYRFKVKTEDGEEEVEMTPDEMQKGVMLERDYRRKTAEIARLRESVTKETQQALEARTKEYIDNLSVMQQVIIRQAAPEFEGVDMAKLAESDPAEYVRLSNKMQQIQQAFYAAEQEKARIANEAQAQYAKKVEEAWNAVAQSIPDWSQDRKEQLISAGMKEYGLKRDDVANITDPVLIQILADAVEHRKLKSGASVVQKKVVQAPKILKPAQGQNKDQDRFGQIRKSLKKTGSIDAFAALMLEQMKG